MRQSPSKEESSPAASHLEQLLAKVISDVERLESMVVLQRGMLRQGAALDAGRLKRQTESLSEGIEATRTNLRQALSELRVIEAGRRSDRGTPAPRRAR